MRARIFSAVAALSMLLAACEDEGNPGDDNLLTGGSLIVVLIVVGIVAWLMYSRRGRGAP